MTGLVIQGSNGEAAHLSHEERSLTVRTIKTALDEAGYPDLPLIVGTGAPSVRETVQLCKQVRDSTLQLMVLGTYRWSELCNRSSSVLLYDLDDRGSVVGLLPVGK
jgi:dihydrodipicolinate synthase/N-acetylneuraminate lyase